MDYYAHILIAIFILFAILNISVAVLFDLQVPFVVRGDLLGISYLTFLSHWGKILNPPYMPWWVYVATAVKPGPRIEVNLQMIVC